MLLLANQPIISTSLIEEKSNPFNFSTDFANLLERRINTIATRAVSLEDVNTFRVDASKVLVGSRVRNCVLCGGLYNTVNQWTTLTPGYGLSARIEASETNPLIVTIADGFYSEGVDKNVVYRIPYEIVVENLTPSTTNYIFLEKVGSLVIVGSSTVKPTVGKYLDSGGLYLLQRFNNSMVDEVSGDSWLGGDGYSSTSLFGDNSRSSSGTAIESPRGVGQSNAWTLEWWWYFTSFAQLYRIFMINDNTKSMPSLSVDTWGAQLRIWVSSDGQNANLYSGYIANHTFNTLNTWRHVALQYDGQYLSLWEHGQLLFSQPLVGSPFSSSNTRFVLPQQTAAWSGYVDEVSFVPYTKYNQSSTTIPVPTIAAQAPSVALYDYMKGHFLVGGVGQTQPKSRVYLGEVVTNSSGVVSVLSYTQQGLYDSGWFNVTPNTTYTVNHNMGVDLYNSQISIKDGDFQATSQSSGNTLSNGLRCGVSIVEQNTNDLKVRVQTSYLSDVVDSNGVTKTQFFKPKMRVITQRGF